MRHFNMREAIESAREELSDETEATDTPTHVEPIEAQTFTVTPSITYTATLTPTFTATPTPIHSLRTPASLTQTPTPTGTDFPPLEQRAAPAELLHNPRNPVDYTHLIGIMRTFAWDEHMDTGGARTDTPPDSGYASILDQALEMGVIDQEEINDIDERYLCQISGQLMDNPVYDKTTKGESFGSRYNKEHLETWIKQKGENPETRQVTYLQNLVTDVKLSMEIDEFMQGIMTRVTLSSQSRPKI